MRYRKGHKEAIRESIVDKASRRFRKDGVAAVGVVELMAEAGLTHGGFYKYFSSKEELVQEAVGSVFEKGVKRLEQLAAEGGLDAIIERYLSSEHRDDPARGCVIACLSSELGRHPPATRQAMDAGLERILAVLARHVPRPEDQDARDRALAVFGAMLGGLQLARLVSDPLSSERILAGAVASARRLAEYGQSPSSRNQPEENDKRH